MEGHRAPTRGTDGRNPAGCHESRAMDGALPHRGTHRERDDVQLRCFAALRRGVDRRSRFTDEGCWSERSAWILATSSWRAPSVAHDLPYAGLTQLHPC